MSRSRLQGRAGATAGLPPGGGWVRVAMGGGVTSHRGFAFQVGDLKTSLGVEAKFWQGKYRPLLFLDFATSGVKGFQPRGNTQ